MKKLSIIAVLGVTMFVVTNVQASLIAINVNYESGYHYGNGGEFNISPVIGGSYAPSVLVSGGYESFCVDTGIGILVPGTYYASTSSGGPIALGTAYLYYEFAKGILSGYDYVDTTINSQAVPVAYGGASGLTGRDVSAFLLQDAIWYLNDQGGFDGSFTLTAAEIAANPFLQDVIGAYGSLASAEVASGGAFGVGTLALYDNPDGTGAAQPMLYLPDGGSTVMLLGLVLGGIGLVSRKFSRV